MVLTFSEINGLINYLVERVDKARASGNNCIFVDSVSYRGMTKSRDAVISFFQERNESVEIRPCKRGYYDIIITWSKND